MSSPAIARRVTPILAVIVLVLVVAGCGASSVRTAAVAVSLKATDLKYEPAQIEVTGAGPVAVTVRNAGAVEHNFVIDGVLGKLSVQPGQTGVETFTLPKTGTYTFHCSIAGHTEAGMKGTLVVR